MIRLTPRFASHAKPKKRIKKLKKQKPRLIIRKNMDCMVEIRYGTSRVEIDTQNMSEWDEFSAIKNEILKMGIVFTRKIEKNVEKALYS
jgi:hypothetical protein